MKDVARRAGVDVSTVSLAINNDPRIREQTRDRILIIAKELGYQRNHLARGLRSGKSWTIGAVVGYSSSFWGKMLAGAQSVLAEREYHLLLDYAPDATRQEEVQIEALKAKRVDGLIIAPSDNDPPIEYYRALEREHIPFVFVDRFVPGLDTDYVAADNFSAARTAARHLVCQLGHQRVAYLYAPQRMNTSQRERLDGYGSVMREMGLAPLPWEVTLTREHRRQEGREAMQDLLADRAGANVTAVLASSDAMAMGVLRALHDAGRRVPGDVALMGFDGVEAGEYLEPPLSTMAMPMRVIGEQAARLLLSRIEGDITTPPRHVVLPAQLTVRASCGASRPAPRLPADNPPSDGRSVLG